MQKYSIIFCFIMMISVVSDLLADLLAIQMFTIGALTFTGGEFVFPIVYIINDIVTEVYGYNTAKKMIWGGLITNAYALTALTAVSYLAGSESTMYQFIIGEYGVASAITVAIAGFSAYTVASFVNAWIMSKMKEKHKEKKFALRALVSTVFGEICDSAVFGLVACSCGLYSWSSFIPLTVTVVIMKTIVEILCLPITAKAVKSIKKLEVQNA